MKYAMLAVVCAAVVLSCTAGANGAKGAEGGLPGSVQPPTREQIDKAMDHLKKKREKASGAEREKIDRVIERLKEYKAGGMDAKKMAEAGPQGGGSAKPARARIRPPVKGGVFKPQGTSRR